MNEYLSYFNKRVKIVPIILLTILMLFSITNVADFIFQTNEFLKLENLFIIKLISLFFIYIILRVNDDYKDFEKDTLDNKYKLNNNKILKDVSNISYISIIVFNLINLKNQGLNSFYFLIVCLIYTYFISNNFYLKHEILIENLSRALIFFIVPYILIGIVDNTMNLIGISIFIGMMLFWNLYVYDQLKKGNKICWAPIILGHILEPLLLIIINVNWSIVGTFTILSIINIIYFFKSKSVSKKVYISYLMVSILMMCII